MPKCAEWAQERINECSDWEDQGYSSCDDWDKNCCDWRPCSWFCKLFTWVCVAFVWITKWVCVGWVLVTTFVCVVWDLIVTIVNVILVTLESIFGWILSAIGFVIELILAIPFFGAIIKWLVNLGTWLGWNLAGLPDFVLGLLGIRPEKTLRICTVILCDERGQPVASVDYAVALLQLAADVYKRDANVRIVRSAPFQYGSGFAGSGRVDADWVQIDTGSSESYLLEPPCGLDGFGDEWGLAGSKFQLKLAANCFFGSWRRILGYGAPVACFIVRGIKDQQGCSLYITDFTTIVGEQTLPPSVPRVIAHELGHACNLSHRCVDDDIRNMMGIKSACHPDSHTNPDTADPRISNFQALLIRASKHVTYF